MPSLDSLLLLFVLLLLPPLLPVAVGVPGAGGGSWTAVPPADCRAKAAAGPCGVAPGAAPDDARPAAAAAVLPSGSACQDRVKVWWGEAAAAHPAAPALPPALLPALLPALPPPHSARLSPCNKCSCPVAGSAVRKWPGWLMDSIANSCCRCFNCCRCCS